MVKWEDSPSTNTPLNAANLNKMQTDLQYGTIIQEGQDLNEITEVGLYHSQNASITNTLVNSPIRDNGFRLEVININIPNRLLQIININSRDEIWIRRLNTLIANEDNGEWVKIVNENDLFPQIYGVGKAISSGSNLNNFTKIGNYYSESATISATLQNCPLNNSAFKLKVENIARTDRYIQTIIANNNEVKIYARVFDSSQTWGEWIEVTGQYLKKIGGTITGDLMIENNQDIWRQLGIQRTAGGTKYEARLGIASNKSASIDFQDVTTGKRLNRLDLMPDGKLLNFFTGRSYAEYESKDTGLEKGELLIGNILIQFGRDSLIPTAANTPTKKTITFKYKFKNAPNVQVTVLTTVPGTSVTGVGIMNTTETKTDIYVTRINTNETYFDWFAIGLANDTVTKL